MSTDPTTPTTERPPAAGPITATLMAILFWFAPSVFHAAYDPILPLSGAVLFLLPVWELRVLGAPMMSVLAIYGFAQLLKTESTP